MEVESEMAKNRYQIFGEDEFNDDVIREEGEEKDASKSKRKRIRLNKEEEKLLEEIEIKEAEGGQRLKY